MNICIIAQSYSPIINGIATTVHRIAGNLTKGGLNVHVIAPGKNLIEETIIPEWERGLTVLHRTFEAKNYFDGQLELRETVEYVKNLNREVHFDLVHELSFGMVGMNVAEAIDRPLIISIQENRIANYRYNPVLLATMKWVLERTSLLTSINQESIKQTKIIAKVPDFKIIPNAFDPGLFDFRPLGEIGYQEGWKYRRRIKKILRAKNQGEIVIGTCGILDHAKGLSFLMEAFVNLHKIFPNTFLLLVGDFLNDNDKLDAIKKIKKLKIEQHFLLTSLIPHGHMIAWMHEIDIFVFPVLYEGTSNAVMEAMGCGLPVIASNVGSLKNAISDGKDGLLTPPRSIKKLIQQLTALVQNENLRKQLGESAKEKIANFYSAGQEIDTWTNVYRDVVNNGSSSVS